MKPDYTILPINKCHHLKQVVELWSDIFTYGTPWNDPELSIRKKEAVDDNLLFVAESNDGELLGTVMGGYDGHRGWIYSLAVKPENRIVVSRYSEPLTLLHPQDYDYFQVLRSKLFWSTNY